MHVLFDDDGFFKLEDVVAQKHDVFIFMRSNKVACEAGIGALQHMTQNVKASAAATTERGDTLERDLNTTTERACTLERALAAAQQLEIRKLRAASLATREPKFADSDSNLGGPKSKPLTPPPASSYRRRQGRLYCLSFNVTSYYGDYDGGR